jgi:large subunit ribosomal protein L1
MGKIRTRILGLEDVEKKQKKEQKEKSERKSKKGEIKEVRVEHAQPIQEKDKKEKKKSASTERKSVRSRGDKYKKAVKLVDKNKTYSVEEAVKLLKKMKYASFDESVEIHLNVDETGLKGEVSLPHATGKIIRIKIVDDTVLTNLEKGIIDFDLLITHPSFMPKLAKFAKVLGPKGLMPNPKAGTISLKPKDVVKKFEKGTMRWKTEAKFPLIHQMIGKISFDEKVLIENTQAFMQSVKTNHIKKAFIKNTMSPAVRLEVEKI